MGCFQDVVLLVEDQVLRQQLGLLVPQVLRSLVLR
jgi:hypothetical protein